MRVKWIFWGAVILVVYTYVGYVCWLRLRLVWRPRPVLRGSWAPSVSIVMVVRNEENLLEMKLKNLGTLDYPSEQLQVVVVSDGSTDRTEEILRASAADPSIQVVLSQLAQGKAAGLNDAIQVARGEIVV